MIKYKVHRINVKVDNMQVKLEQFLNNLEGEVVSIIPNVTPQFLTYGAKIDFLLIIEKIKS